MGGSITGGGQSKKCVCVRSRVCGHVYACTQSLGPKAEDTLVLCVKDRWAEDLCPRGGPRSQQLL